MHGVGNNPNPCASLSWIKEGSVGLLPNSKIAKCGGPESRKRAHAGNVSEIKHRIFDQPNYGQA
jgi:hypothetical protein